MKNILIITLLGISNCLFSQTHDLNIYYNVYKDSLWFLKNNKTIEEPIVKKGAQVYFHLVDFNNYIYKAEFKATQSSAPLLTSAPSNSIIKGLLSGLVGGFLPGIGLPLLNSPLFGNILGAIPAEEAGNAGRGDNDDLLEFEAKIKELEATKEEINSISMELNVRKKSLTSLNNSLEFTNSLITNPNISPMLIRELLLDHCAEVFLKSKEDEIILQDVSILNEKLMEIPSLEKNLRTKISSYDRNLEILKTQRVKLQNSDHGIDALYPLIKKLESTESQMSKTIFDMSAKLEAQCLVDSVALRMDYTSKIQQYYLKYHEIKENNFSYTHHSGMAEKYLNYDLNLFRNDSMENGDIKSELVKHVEVKIKSYGGVAFGMSIGLTGSKFIKTPQNYFVRNVNGFSRIYASDADPYVPMITSLFSLRYDMRSSFTPNISLGIGIPFSKNESVENFAIFAGPGFYIGKKQAFMISGGTMFSKVKQLSNGFNVGDEIFIGEGDVPTTKRYSFGYFLGMTFNISAF
ncbi:MAG: hypothetical protein ABI851_04205 [Saprospiraceae bacterium]